MAETKAEEKKIDDMDAKRDDKREEAKEKREEATERRDEKRDERKESRVAPSREAEDKAIDNLKKQHEGMFKEDASLIREADKDKRELAEGGREREERGVREGRRSETSGASFPGESDRVQFGASADNFDKEGARTERKENFNTLFHNRSDLFNDAMRGVDFARTTEELTKNLEDVIFSGDAQNDAFWGYKKR